MIAVVDYGAGNLHSLRRALERQGLEVAIADSPAALDAAEAVVVPGDGAFGPAMERLRALGFAGQIREYVRSGRPFLGVCLGMHLLFEASEEGGDHRGLGLFAGRVVRLPPTVKVPHMGWNQLRVHRPTPLLEGVPEGVYVYFVHSFVAVPEDPTLIAATTEYGGPVAAVVGRGSVWATQFHPEKSGPVGVRILANFARWIARARVAGR